MSLRQRWRLLRLRIRVRSRFWLCWDLFWISYWLVSGVIHVVNGQWWAGLYVLFIAWYIRRLGQDLGLIESRFTPSGYLVVAHGPIYPGREAIEDARAKGLEEKLEADPRFCLRPEPDFAYDFGYTRARKPTECPRCDRPLEPHTLRGPGEHFEDLVCYAGRASAGLRRHLPEPIGHHYEYRMGPFRNAPRPRRKIAIPKLVLAPRPVGM